VLFSLLIMTRGTHIGDLEKTLIFSL
jgi:hypothetical protein